MPAPRRFLGLPHRALRYLRIRWFDAGVGLLALVCVVIASWVLRPAIWEWQFSIWRELAARVGIAVTIEGLEMRWEQSFFVPSTRDVLIATVAFLLSTWLLLRSTFSPTVKGLFIVITLPVFLYSLVVWIQGDTALASLARTTPDWLLGEIYVWWLITGLYAIFVFPIPLALPVKLISLAGLLCMSVIWRTITPVIYMTAAVYSEGMFAIQAWMTLGPWSDFFYFVPLFSATLTLHKEGRLRDYRA